MKNERRLNPAAEYRLTPYVPEVYLERRLQQAKDTLRFIASYNGSDDAACVAKQYAHQTFNWMSDPWT